MTLPTCTGEFRAVADPELRFAPSGMAVAKVRIVANSRKKDPDTDQWKDDKVCWLTLTAFGRVAENIAESVVKGSLIEATGRLQTEEWETKEGEKRTGMSLVADRVGLSLAFVPAKAMERTVKRESAPAEGGDPWVAPAQDDEPPF